MRVVGRAGLGRSRLEPFTPYSQWDQRIQHKPFITRTQAHLTDERRASVAFLPVFMVLPEGIVRCTRTVFVRRHKLSTLIVVSGLVGGACGERERDRRGEKREGESYIGL